MAGHDLALFQHLCFSSYKWQQQDTVSSVLLCQPVWWQSPAVNTCPWGHSPALGVTRLPLESPMFPRSHPLPRDRLCPSLSQESCCAGCTSQQELGPRALQSCLPGFQGTSPGMLWEVFPRPGLRPDAIVIFISKQETGSLPGQAGVGRNCCHKLP